LSLTAASIACGVLPALAAIAAIGSFVGGGLSADRESVGAAAAGDMRGTAATATAMSAGAAGRFVMRSFIRDRLSGEWVHL